MDEQLFESSIVPTLAFVGASGSGRRKLVNALVRCELEHVDLHEDPDAFWAGFAERPKSALEPCVRVCLIDTPSSDTEGEPEMADRILQKLLPAVQVLVWVIDYPARIQEADLAFLGKLRSLAPAMPLLVLGSGVDRAAPGTFSGEEFDPGLGRTPEEVAVRVWLDGIGKASESLDPSFVIACAAGDGTPETCFHLATVSDTLATLLPKAARMDWQCCSLVEKTRAGKAEKMVIAATAVAGGIGVAPLPVADMPFIVTTQITLLAGLFSLYNRPLDRKAARSLVLAGLSAVAGPLAFGTLSKIIPGLGSVIGGGVAAACTWAVGEVAKTVLEEGGTFEAEDFCKAVRKLYDEKRSSFGK